MTNYSDEHSPVRDYMTSTQGPERRYKRPDKTPGRLVTDYTVELGDRILDALDDLSARLEALEQPQTEDVDEQLLVCAACARGSHAGCLIERCRCFTGKASLDPVHCSTTCTQSPNCHHDWTDWEHKVASRFGLCGDCRIGVHGRCPGTNCRCMHPDCWNS